MAYLLLVYLGTSLLPLPPKTGPNSHFLVTLIDYRDWLQRKKKSNLKCNYVKTKEGGEEVGGAGREEEGKKEEEKTLLSLLCSKFCINAFTCIALFNISINLCVILFSFHSGETWPRTDMSLAQGQRTNK